MKLILSGGGTGEKTRELDELFASLIDKNKPLLYIPIAIDKIKHPYSECLKWLRGTFDKLSVDLYEMWIEEDLNRILDKPEKFGGIYIGGGNTFYLLKVLKETRFWEFLKDCMNRNIPIYGGSAGAIIFGFSIITSYDTNSVNLKDFNGMDILNGISIFCHYKQEKYEVIKQKILLPGLEKIIALPETTGVYVNNGKLTIIGKDPAWLFFSNKKIKLNKGKSFDTF